MAIDIEFGKEVTTYPERVCILLRLTLKRERLAVFAEGRKVLTLIGSANYEV